MEHTKEIADFLRGRRARLTPGEAGLTDDGRARRVPGLRRDEVARLAGVSSEYYTRLEQGRSANPSPEVLDALARALRLDETEREYLSGLWARKRGARRTPEPPQRIRPGVGLTLDALERVPAFVLGRRTEVLASNRLARAVLTDFDALPATKRQLARWTLLDPEARERCLDWERLAADTVAILRFEAGRHPGDRRLADLVGELTLGCPEFTGWWNDHRVLLRTHGTKRYHHPDAGDLTFAYESFAIPGSPGQTLCVYNAEPGSATARALRFLGDWATPHPDTETDTAQAG
ncbi:helix-turn-helix domain-containing protein [Streptomyces zingiberis]|uniref:Helix-turn-helix transcriptional regulator n=1 Tax=Streptomyces zingiberis TaxID=2053010 RepID=A0ABX1BST9_9ACTN|nr:helix-turn-helix domain-containing protein [Streptomyces zingiberis]NJQ00779.1 helix-turn-helix transcriptional regulator [Streptomyces zingiberis]